MNAMDTLTTLFSHNRWANLRLLEHCHQLTHEQLEATTIGTYGSIRAILEHITTAERSYFSRVSTGQPFPRQDAPPMTLADMEQALRATGQGFIEWAPRVQADEHVTVDWDGTPREVPKTILLTQAINHATEHREQIKAILTQLGIEPPDLAGWAYFDATDQ